MVRVVEGDLLDQRVDAIVNAWNRNIIPWWLLLPQGVSGAIKRRAGYQPFRELARVGPMPLGSAVVTIPLGRLVSVRTVMVRARSQQYHGWEADHTISPKLMPVNYARLGRRPCRWRRP
jgi:O-acetyl-ADP-ribose deacetylase (regulator of RNase III)